jgi:trk system potassium uptake protein TrkH
MDRGVWKPRPGDRVVRHPRQEQMSPVRLTIRTPRARSPALATPLVLLYTFIGLIAVGTLLLLMPFSHEGGGFTPVVDALFTATSAVTVTGLVTRETGTYWTPIGQVFILVMIFVGGLSFMTLATFLLIIMGQRLSLEQRMLARDSYQINQLGGLVRLTVWVVAMAAAIQFVGFLALAVRFSMVLDSPSEALWQAVFHSVSAFNSAGFIAFPWGDSLATFQQDKTVLGIMGILIFLGAISYLVMVDVIRFRRFSLFSLNTKLVLILTAALTISGATVFFTSEQDNPKTLGPLGLGDKVMVSFFESTSGRTAGFSTVSYGDTAQHTNFFFTSLMFIGGASASVAGGIKINTLAVVLVAVLSTLRGRAHARAFGREIPQVQVQRAMTIGSLAMAFAFVMALLLTFSEREFAFIDLLFEAVSAFGTVGLSTGLTAELSRWGHVILIITMFAGRVGPFTLGLTMIQRGESDLYRYAKERVTIG